MGETCDSAEPKKDQRDLIRLMFRELLVDVTTGRVVTGDVECFVPPVPFTLDDWIRPVCCRHKCIPAKRCSATWNTAVKSARKRYML